MGALAAGAVDKRQEQSGQTTLVFPPYLHTYGIRKATQAKLFMISKLSGFNSRFNNPQGAACVRLLNWDDPAKDSDDDQLTVYGVNSGNHEIIYNISMFRLARYGGPGAGIGQFQSPRGIAADEHGRVYVCDTDNDRVVKLYNPQQYLQWVKSMGNSGMDRLKSPRQAALTSWGDLYVTDFGNNRVAVFDSTGRMKNTFSPADGTRLEGPEAIALCDHGELWQFFNRHNNQIKKSGLAGIPRDRLYVADRNGTRLFYMDLEGKILRVVNADRERGYAVNYRFMACDYYGNVYLTEWNRCCVHKYSPELEFLESYGTRGTGDRQFDEPRGITIHKRFGQVFVVEREGAQYYWIGTDIRNMNVQKKGENQLDLQFFGTEPAYLTVSLRAGDSTSIPLTRMQFCWSGLNQIPLRVPEGPLKIWKRDQLKIQIVFEPTYSSFTYFWKKFGRPLP